MRGIISMVHESESRMLEMRKAFFVESESRAFLVNFELKALRVLDLSDIFMRP